ncbi:MAG: hypothetical protein AAF569_04760 [Pseudomonadota bacterium]
MLQKIWLLSLFLILASPALTQDYTPPPMFDAPSPLPPANAPQTPTDITPVPKPLPKTESVPKPPVKEANIEDVPKIVLKTPPLPPKKPEPSSQTIAKEQPKVRPGVVKGPKTMPSVPAQDYDAETLFQGEDGEVEGAILKRHSEEKIEEQKTESKPDIPPETLDKVNVYELEDGNAQKITLIFAQGQSEISQDELTANAAKAANILNKNPEWRLQIMSYATAYDQGQSSDRRMSLNRALSLRDAMLDQNIEARIIDVRALGDAADSAPKDRIDLIFYGAD